MISAFLVLLRSFVQHKYLKNKCVQAKFYHWLNRPSSKQCHQQPSHACVRGQNLESGNRKSVMSTEFCTYSLLPLKVPCAYVRFS